MSPSPRATHPANEPLAYGSSRGTHPVLCEQMSDGSRVAPVAIAEVGVNAGGEAPVVGPVALKGNDYHQALLAFEISWES